MSQEKIENTLLVTVPLVAPETAPIVAAYMVVKEAESTSKALYKCSKKASKALYKGFKKAKKLF